MSKGKKNVETSDLKWVQIIIKLDINIACFPKAKKKQIKSINKEIIPFAHMKVQQCQTQNLDSFNYMFGYSILLRRPGLSVAFSGQFKTQTDT